MQALSTHNTPNDSGVVSPISVALSQIMPNSKLNPRHAMVNLLYNERDGSLNAQNAEDGVTINIDTFWRMSAEMTSAHHP